MIRKNYNIIILILLILFVIGAIILSEKSVTDRRSEYIKKEDVLELYAGCDSGENTVTAMFMNDFARRVKEKSNGKIVIDTYSDSKIGGDSELLEACQSGNISFVFQTTAPQFSLIPETAIFDIPMKFDSLEGARREIDEKILDKLKPYYREKNLDLLGIADQGFREMTSNKKINSFEDFKGVKIRTMENKNHIKFWKSLGANPTPMSYSEVYIGLQQGTIDAQENPLEAIITPRFYEQQDYLIMTNHLLHPVTCVASRELMNSLSAEYRKIIEDSISESVVWARHKTDSLLKERIQTIIDSGTQIINIDEKTRKIMIEKGELIGREISD